MNTINRIPGNGHVIVFDCETTGLYKSDFWGVIEGTEPYITQFSYLVYNTNTHRIVKIVDRYILLPENVSIDPEAEKITGITKEMCREKGVPIQTALAEFYHDYISCDKAIAHNFEFDCNVLRAEIRRNMTILLATCPLILEIFRLRFLIERDMQCVCTMLTTTDLCKLEHKTPPSQTTLMLESVGIPRSYKWPKLSELHNHLFGYVPDNLHNSLMDILVCLRCYLFLRENRNISSCDFTKMVNSCMLSPEKPENPEKPEEPQKPETLVKINITVTPSTHGMITRSRMRTNYV